MSKQESVELSVFEYLYRDGGNFKTQGAVVLRGYQAEAEGVILGCLDWGRQFVAEQVGIPSLCAAHWIAVGEGPSELDHAYHEMLRLRRASAQARDLIPSGTLAALLAKMQAAAGRWDVRLSPNCDL